jgi:hypothetical protein
MTTLGLRDRPALRLEDATFHDIDGALHEIDQAIKCCENSLVFGDIRLAERYINGQLHILLYCSAGEGRPIDFCIVVQKFDDVCAVGRSVAQVEAERLSPFSGATYGHAIWGHEQKRNPTAHKNLCLSDSDRHNGVMLVQDVQLMEHPECFVPSLIRFQSLDENLSLNGNVVEFSNARFSKFLSVSRNRKAIPGNLFATSSHDTANQLIQSRSEVMNDVSDQNTKIGWHAFVNANAINIASGLRVCLSDQFVWFAFKESFPGGIYFSKVEFRSGHL